MSLKKYRGIFISIFFLFLLCCLGLFITLKYSSSKLFRNDAIRINRLSKEVSENWEDLSLGDYSDYIYPFAVLNNNQQLLFSWKEPEAVTLQDVMRYSEVCLPVEKDGLIVGTLIIETHTLQQQQLTSFLLRLGLVLCSFTVLCFLALLFYSRYLHTNILQPFYLLHDFSKRISQGDYDTKLDIAGNKAFLPFVQGLDVMREELRLAKQREYEANQSKKNLVASLSHDIKTPVTSIKLAVELLEVQVTDEQLRQRLNAILAKAEQINFLVSDLFHTTMEDMSQLTVAPQDIYSTKLAELVRNADLNQSVKTLSIPDCMIKADPLRMEQVLTNILYNSYKYAKTDIKITASTTSEYLVLSIQDFGDGVSEDELPCLYNRFYRGKNTDGQAGSGLGLYICKSLIDKMDGEIYSLNNTEGFETIIKLPLV